jgi:hypothetical protein
VIPLAIEPYMDAAHDFVRTYAATHEYFRSEEVCDAYKAAGLPTPPDKGWRDRWGTVMTRAKNSGFIKKAGKAAPMSGSTHMASTALWMSNLFKGERTVTETGSDRIEGLRKAWVERRVTDLRQLLWQAYEFGYDQGAAGREKVKK